MKSNLIDLVPAILSFSTFANGAVERPPLGFIGFQVDQNGSTSISCTTETATSSVSTYLSPVISTATELIVASEISINGAGESTTVVSTETSVYPVTSEATVTASMVSVHTTSTVWVNSSTNATVTPTTRTSVATTASSTSVSSAAAATLGLGLVGLMGVAVVAAFL